MIDSMTMDKIKHVTNTEAVRRLLIQYFVMKGYTESFDRHMYPGLVQDLPAAIPILASKVEIQPFAEELDTSMGKAVLGWNMFVLGNHRMYLGDTYHNDLKGLARQIQQGVILPESVAASARRQTTPRKIVTFITRVLGDFEAGYVDLIPGAMGQPGDFRTKNAMSGQPQQFFSRSGYGT